MNITTTLRTQPTVLTELYDVSVGGLVFLFTLPEETELGSHVAAQPIIQQEGQVDV